jgi:hypothetical protein
MPFSPEDLRDFKIWKQGASTEAIDHVHYLVRLIQRFTGPPADWWTVDELSRFGLDSLAEISIPAEGSATVIKVRRQLARGIRMSLRFTEAIARGKAFPHDEIGPQSEENAPIDEAVEALGCLVESGELSESDAKSITYKSLSDIFSEGPLKVLPPKDEILASLPAFDSAFNSPEWPTLGRLCRNADLICDGKFEAGERWGIFKSELLNNLGRTIEARRRSFSVPRWLTDGIVDGVILHALGSDPMILSRQIGDNESPIPIWIPCTIDGKQTLIQPSGFQGIFNWTLDDLREQAASDDLFAKKCLKLVSEKNRFQGELEDFVRKWEERCEKLGNVSPGKLITAVRQILGENTHFEIVRDFMFFFKANTGELFVDSEFKHIYDLATSAKLRKAFKDAQR